MKKIICLWLLGVTASAYSQSKEFVSIGGTVVDEAGQPVAGATVFVSGSGVNATVCGAMPAWADAAGHWRYDRVTPGTKSVELGVWHPRFAPDSNHGFYNYKSYDTAALLDGTHTLTLKRGVIISGLVSDSGGRPIEGARVVYGQDSHGGNALPEQFTGADGRFTIATVPHELAWLTVMAAGFAPELKKIYVREEPVSAEFKLTAPLTLSGRVVNASGQPVRDATVYFDTWRGARTLKVSVKADADGRFVWTDAPADEITARAYCEGYAASEPSVSAGRDNVIVLQNPTSVSGMVFDAETNKPINAFTVTRGLCWKNNSHISWQQHITVSGSGGAFIVEDVSQMFRSDATGHAFRVSADGYVPASSPLVKLDGQRHELKFALKPATELAVQIVDADGQPAAGAEAAVAIRGAALDINDNVFDTPRGDAVVLKGSAAGELKIPAQDDNAKWTLVVLHEKGWALLTAADLPKAPPLTLTLQRWARIEGESRTGTHADAEHQLNLTLNNAVGEPQIRWYNSAKPDAGGKFVFERVPAGSIGIGREIKMKRGATTTYSHQCETQSGVTTSVIIGGTGRPIAGRLIIPEELSNSGATFGMAHLMGTRKAQAADGEPARLFSTVEVRDDGTFQAADLEPGEWSIKVSLYAPGAREHIDQPLAVVSQDFTVPPAATAVSDEVYQVPPIPLKLSAPAKR